MALPLLAAGLIAGGTALASGLSSWLQNRATKEAAGEQLGAIDESMGRMQELLSPYAQAGEQALTQQQALAGALGPEAQQEAILMIEQSPQMAALTQQGETSILQNAAATGGLRGGNTQAALAQFRPQMLSQLIDQRYGQLGGLAAAGQTAATNLGTTQGNLMLQRGQLQGGLAAAPWQTGADILGGLSQGLGTFAGLI